MNITTVWYEKKPRWFLWLLYPFHCLYCLVSYGRNKAYEKGYLKIHQLPVPVWVIGNMTIGGTGKTPLVIAIVQWLKGQGLKPGIVSRGYGGKEKIFPHRVELTDTATQVGDEPLLIAQHTQCPVVIDPCRVRGAKALVKLGVNIIVSDDGFQHHSLYRDCNIVVVDGIRRYGNGYCLPMGPLREPLSALQRTHLVVCNGDTLAQVDEYPMILQPQLIKPCVPLFQKPINKNQPVHAVAAIGHPQRFFDLLEREGYRIIPHEFPDHHRFTAADLNFGDENPIIMTEKDGVKCKEFAQPHWWVLPVEAMLAETFWNTLATYLPKKNVLC